MDVVVTAAGVQGEDAGEQLRPAATPAGRQEGNMPHVFLRVIHAAVCQKSFEHIKNPDSNFEHNLTSCKSVCTK